MIEALWGALLEKIVSLASWLPTWFQPPTLEIVESSTKYGWLASPDGPPTLLLTVKIRNEEDKTIVVRSLQLKYGNRWLGPKDFPGERLTANLLYRTKQDKPGQVLSRHDAQLDPNKNIVRAPFIPPSKIAKRYAVFDLPVTGTELPDRVEATAKVKFAKRRPRYLVLSLSNAS